MGWSRADLFVTFLLQALILGAAGVLVGGIIAVSVVRYLVAHPIFNWQGFVVRPVLTAMDLARTAGAILATAIVAGTYPAWRAARLDPSRILRGHRMSATPPLVATNLVRRYGDRTIVDHVSLSIDAGESVSLMGASGCGKTTLLHMLGTLDRPDEGQVWIEGKTPRRSRTANGRSSGASASASCSSRATSCRRSPPGRTSRCPAWRATGRRRESWERADALLARFGLTARADARAHLLSLGEAQRVAVARALINRPRLVLADEPTGSLDSEATAAVLDALGEVCGTGAALLVVTHNPAVAERCARQLVMHDGRLQVAAARRGSASRAAPSEPRGWSTARAASRTEPRPEWRDPTMKPPTL